jgi:hypothetical protein
MDLFKFNPGSDPSFLTNGEILNRIKTIQWVERYRDPGEFEITAGVSSDLRTRLPVGTMISHIDTLEVMMVESVNIKEDTDGEEPQITIRGRSLESYLKHRIVGDDIETYIDIGTGLHLMTGNEPYQIPFGTSWEQIKYMIDQHITSLLAGPTGDVVAGFVAIENQQHIGSSTAQARTMRKQNLHSAVLELLAVDDFGIQTVRPNSGNVDPTTTEFRIHNGSDLTTSVIFSHSFGDLEKSEYFWSDAALKTDYLCVSNYYNLRSDYAIEGYNRRVMYVDCSDIDEMYDDTEVVDGTIVIAIHEAMDVRGQQALRAQVLANLMSTDVSRRTRYKFKKHYDVGDLVTVQGNYDVETVMRIAEHVVFQDENGESGYPTLAALNE